MFNSNSDAPPTRPTDPVRPGRPHGRANSRPSDRKQKNQLKRNRGDTKTETSTNETPTLTTLQGADHNDRHRKRRRQNRASMERNKMADIKNSSFCLSIRHPTPPGTSPVGDRGGGEMKKKSANIDHRPVAIQTGKLFGAWYNESIQVHKHNEEYNDYDDNPRHSCRP